MTNLGEKSKQIYRMLFHLLCSLARWFSLPALVLSMAVLFNSGEQSKDTVVGASFGVAMVLLGEWMFILLFRRALGSAQPAADPQERRCCQVLK